MCGKIAERWCLNKPGSVQETWLIVLDLVTPIEFSPGDSIGIYPKNAASKVKELLRYFRLPENSLVKEMPLVQFLQERVEISTVSSRLRQRIAQCAYLEADREKVASVPCESPFDLLLFLQEYVPGGVSLYDILDGFTPLRPRLYSIASGPTGAGRRLELMVARVRQWHGEYPLNGTCSHYLIEEANLHCEEIRFFVHPARQFILPKKSERPLLMVASGTGIAPFRSFMQEIEIGAREATSCWLFFGERQRSTDFYHEEFWQRQIEAGRLRLDLAFSRDQEEKLYVQHRMWEQRKDVWHWLEDGASIFVCGNARTMAKDVDRCLSEIAVDQGKIHHDQALSWLRDLHHQGRYLRDIY